MNYTKELQIPTEDSFVLEKNEERLYSNFCWKFKTIVEPKSAPQKIDF